MASIKPSLVEAVVHSSISLLRMMYISAISIGIGSVGISATPIRAVTVLISGKFSNRIVSIFFETSMDSVSELPGLINACIAISPSSSCGTNSPPILENINPAIISRTAADDNTISLSRSAPFNNGL